MSSNTIQLAGTFRREENIGNGSIKPGMLLQKYNNAGTANVRAHPTAGGMCEVAVAVEDDLQGKTVDDAYTTATLVQYNLQKPGNVVQMLLKAGENVVIGDELVSAGDGTVIEDTSLASAGLLKKVLGHAEEAMDLSGSGAVDTLIAVRVW